MMLIFFFEEILLIIIFATSITFFVSLSLGPKFQDPENFLGVLNNFLPNIYSNSLCTGVIYRY